MGSSPRDDRPYRELVIATSNPGKLLEFRAILADLPLSLRSMDAFPEIVMPEEGEEYEANAVAKARSAARGSGRPAIADDSGLEVEGLGHGPGPLSARFGGPGLSDAERVAKLLIDLEGMDGDARRARFVCVAALAFPDGEVVTARGECPGRILEAPRGGAGFGYDPVFEVEGRARTMAEIPPQQKNRVSHRARALAGLTETLRKRIQSTA